MIALLLFQAPPPPSQIQSQPMAISVGDAMPSALDALIKAKNWGGLADWFETVPPPTRGKYYEWWIQALNRSQRWERLLVVCEALQPQLEAKSGPRLATYRLYRAQALSQLGRHQRQPKPTEKTPGSAIRMDFPTLAPRPGSPRIGTRYWLSPTSCCRSAPRTPWGWPGGVRPWPAWRGWPRPSPSSGRPWRRIRRSPTPGTIWAAA